MVPEQEQRQGQGTHVERVTHGPDETAAVGAWLGKAIAQAAPSAARGSGIVIHLLGDLGAGKTVFVRGLAEGLGIDPDEVNSPTFTLIQEYASAQAGALGEPPRKLFHVDLYRLVGAEVGDLGLDALNAEGVVAIEWANRLPDADPRAIVVRIDDDGDERRRIAIDGPADIL